MSTFNVNCPLCSQTIECDAQFAGQEVQCPGCGGNILLPALEAAAPAPPPAGGRTRLNVAPGPKPHAASAPPPPSYPPPPAYAGTSYPPAKQGAGKTKLIVGWTIGILVAGVAIYFLMPVINNLQAKFNKAAGDASSASGGGEAGHIAGLYDALDATDPARFETFHDDVKIKDEPAAPPRKKAIDLPIVAPTWSLDTEVTDIPAARLNGTVAGTNFVADICRFEKTGAVYFLQLRMGTNAIPDRELTIFLRPKPGVSVETNSWIVTKDLKSGVPQVKKKWKTGARAMAERTFGNGYVMKLELGKFEEGIISGKLYLALPDNEQTVIAGQFDAETHLGIEAMPSFDN
jgi:hypothetical protein